MARYQRNEEVEEQVEDQAVPEAPETEVENSEEDTFKKRYGDLRRYMQQSMEAKDKELESLKSKLENQKEAPPSLPKTEDEIMAWAEKYPEVAKIVDSIAQKRAREASQEVEASMSDLRKMKKQLEREKAEHQLKTMHPDFDRIRADSQFHQWVKEQPTYIQDALYKNDNDAVSAARAIDLYKADMGMISEKRTDAELEREAASAVKRSGKSAPSGAPKGKWTESRVASLKPYEYEKYEDEILEAMQSGKFEYDMSAGAY